MKNNKKHIKSSSSSRSSSKSRSRSRSRSPLKFRKDTEKTTNENMKKIEGDKENIKSEEKPAAKIEQPSFQPSGILAKFTNTVNGTVLKFTEPVEAKKPDETWKIFPFKGTQAYDVIQLKGQSCFLFGKDRRIADFTLDHPSISNQHAVVQFREISKEDDCGNLFYIIKPYIMDLESTNGTFLNSEKIEAARYYELKHGDVLKFAGSSRDYVIMKQK